MLPGYGHINCTFKFTNRLKDEGYKIVYAVHPQMQSYLDNQGFDTVVCDLQLFTKGSDFVNLNDASINNFFHKVVDRISNTHINRTKRLAKKMNICINKVKPDLILLDSFMSFNYFFIEGRKPPTILLQIMLATRQRKGIPYLNSSALPSNNKFNTLIVRWNWMMRIIGRHWSRFSRLGDNPLHITYRILKKDKTNIKNQLNFDYSFQPSIKSLQELILAPKSIDFPEIAPSNQLYLASSDHDRKEVIENVYMKRLIQQLKTTAQNKVWIYCSLGTLSNIHNKKCKAFFEKLIQVFLEKKEWEIIISTGGIKPEVFFNKAPNIHLVEKAPQLEILKYCRVMITHGGINSMLECINRLVPMLVFPLNNKWDQNGNSARIVYYGLGLRGNIEKITPDCILKKLETLLKSPSYAKNIELMNNKFKKESGFEEAVNLIKTKFPVIFKIPQYELD